MRKRTNVGFSTECELAAVEGTTEARTKDENDCIDVRNREEVPPLIQDGKY